MCLRLETKNKLCGKTEGGWENSCFKFPLSVEIYAILFIRVDTPKVDKSNKKNKNLRIKKLNLTEIFKV